MIRRILTAPALHFLLIGGLLFLWRQDAPSATPDPAVAAPVIAIDDEMLRELRESFAQTTGRDPTAGEEQALLRDHVDQEILYREALLRGLDRGDRSVRWRLIQKMRFLEDREGGDDEALYREALALGLDRDDLIIRRLLIEKMRLLLQLGAGIERPGADILREFYAGVAEDYRQPARVSLWHVFLSSDRRGEALESDAALLSERLQREAPTPEQAIALADVFPLGHRLRANSESNLGKLLGPGFAREAIAFAPGRWHGPVRSAYGLHFVWVDDRREASLPNLDAVRGQVTQRYLAQKREAELARQMERLRERYLVRVAGEAAEPE